MVATHPACLVEGVAEKKQQQDDHGKQVIFGHSETSAPAIQNPGIPVPDHSESTMEEEDMAAAVRRPTGLSAGCRRESRP